MQALKLKNCKRIQGLYFAQDSSRLLALSGWEASGVEIAIWVDLATGEPVRTLTFLADQFAVDVDHTRLVIGTDAYARAGLAKMFRWCDLAEPSSEWQALKLATGWPAGTSAVAVSALALTPDASRLLIAFGRQRFHEGRAGAEWTFHVASCAFDVATSPVVTDLAVQVEALAIAPDGTRWASNQVTDRRPEILLFHHRGERPVARFTTPGMRVGGLTFSPDGQHLAVENGRMVLLLTADTLTEVAILAEHAGQVNGVAFARNSQRLVSASHDGTIRVWDVATGQCVATFDWEIGPVTAIAFAPDGLTCAAAGKNGRVVVWDADE